MLRAVTAHQFLKRMGTGKTKPCLIRCETIGLPHDEVEEDSIPARTDEELIVKFSDGCEAKHQGLVAEALAAMLAADLDLPVPEPFLVQIEPEFTASIPDPEIRTLAQKSVPWAFGSRKLPAQYAAVMANIPLPQSLIPTAVEIVAFDVLIANPDRRAKNPNCLSNSRELAIYDHELAFQTEGVIGWRPPWEENGVFFPGGDFRHVFLDMARGSALDFSRLLGALEAISPARVIEYRQALPEAWGPESVPTDRMIAYIEALRVNASAAIMNISAALR